MRRILPHLILPLYIAWTSGCSSTFDKQGDFNPHRGNRANLQQRLIPADRAQFIHDRSVQLWLPTHPEDGDTTTLVSQAALISGDGYALTAAHAVDDGQVFTFHPQNALHRILKVRQIDGNGIEHLKVDGTSERFKTARLIPVRTVHRFEDADLALVKIKHQTPTFFDLSPSPLSLGDKIFYGYNPIIHKNLRGLMGTVTKIQDLGPDTWKIECSGAAIFGGSGGSVINDEGQLVGTITGASVSFLSPGKEKRVLDVDFQTATPSTVQELIAKDRATPIQDTTKNKRIPTGIEVIRLSQDPP